MTNAKKTVTYQKLVEQYEHKKKQIENNPSVDLIEAHTNNLGKKRKPTNTTHIKRRTIKLNF